MYGAPFSRSMCRLFGQLTSLDHDARYYLVESERSLLRQSNASPQTAQADGWGIAWYEPDGRIHVEKGTGGAFAPAEREHYERACYAARGTLVIGHLRHASNPLDLPRGKLIALENSQPFHDARQIFAHNGAIPRPHETLPYLGSFASEVKGVNDSEVLFWLFARHIANSENPVAAYARTVEDLVQVEKENGPSHTLAYSGLNVVLSRGPDELWAFCHSKGEHGCGLLDPGRPYYEMTYREQPGELVVGSERFDDRPGWSALTNGRYLRARRFGDRIELHTGRIPLPEPVPDPAPPA